eukprot:c44524_g1_i1 orf=2-226(-)
MHYNKHVTNFYIAQIKTNYSTIFHELFNFVSLSVKLAVSLLRPPYHLTISSSACCKNASISSMAILSKSLWEVFS